MKKLAMVLICCILSFSCIGCGNINYQEAISENKEVSYGGYFTEGMSEPEQMEYCNECGQHIARDWSEDDD